MTWALIRPLIAAIAISTSLAGCVWYTHSSGRQSGMQTIQAKWDAEKVLTLEAQGEQIILAQLREAELQTQMDQRQTEYRNDKTRIAADYAALVDSLRDRPEARAGVTGVPDGAAAGVGCTGAGLSRSDGEFLVWIGSEAARTQAALNQCRAAYDALIQ